MTSTLDLPLIGSSGEIAGHLHVACLPRQSDVQGRPPLLLDYQSSQDNDPITAPAQVLEEAEYSYTVELDQEEVRVEPAELFEPSHTDGREGRLRPARSTGTLDVTARTPAGQLIGRCELEVRARKLNYLSEYRWMLQGIADETTELLQRRFAPAALNVFTPSTAGDSKTTYQRFAFLRALLESVEFRRSYGCQGAVDDGVRRHGRSGV